MDRPCRPLYPGAGMRAHEVRTWFEVELLRRLRGGAVVDADLCEDRQIASAILRDQELIYFELGVTYLGDRLHQVLCSELVLEDSDGYLIEPIPPRDSLDVTLSRAERGVGGVMYLIYPDLEPVKLWLDTGIRFERSSDSIHLEIPIEPASPRRPAWQETAAIAFEKQLQVSARDGGAVLPLFETETLMATVSHALGMPYKRVSKGYLFRASLPEGRSQYVLMSFSGKDADGCDLIKFLTICAPVGDGASHAEFLRANPKLCYGGIGISRIEEQDFYVITNTQLVATADVEELVKSISYLARKGDELESQLTGGADVR